MISLSSVRDVFSARSHVALADFEQSRLLYGDDFMLLDLNKIRVILVVGAHEWIHNIHDLR